MMEREVSVSFTFSEIKQLAGILFDIKGGINCGYHRFL
jgi:hypothetical protein